jgi:hypothetical protein
VREEGGEREGERGRGGRREGKREGGWVDSSVCECVCERERVCVCVFMCTRRVCARERHAPTSRQMIILLASMPYSATITYICICICICIHMYIYIYNGNDNDNHNEDTFAPLASMPPFFHTAR